MAKKEVAVATAGELAVLDDDLFSEGTGLEALGTEDYALPFLRVIQSNSPQIKKSEPTKYIEGAEEGDLFNTLTKQVFRGEEGALVVPCAYVKKFIEWVPIDQGGGLVRDDHPASIVNQCTRSADNRQLLLDNGNEIVETSQYFLMLVDNEEVPEQVLLSCTSTQLTFARRWNTMLRTAHVKNNAGESVLAPMFAYTYRIKTGIQSNNRGSWYGLSVERDRPTSMQVAKLSKEFMVAARAGEVNVKQEGSIDSPTTSMDEDIPF
tara:strand:+ start:2385 stop:3176 length:792 start_codon:yes stop_codon:yes gene_type:complete